VFEFKGLELETQAGEKFRCRVEPFSRDRKTT